MKSLTTSTILMLIASSVIFFFVGRYTATPSSTNSTEAVVATKDKVVTTSKGGTDIVDPIAVNDDTKNTTVEDGDVSAEDAAAEKVRLEEAAEKKAAEEKAAAEAELAKKRRVENATSIDARTTLVSSNTLARVKMGISDKKIAEVLSSVSKRMEQQKLAYVSSMMQDCSGIFHQLKDSLQSRLPSLAAGGQYQYPTPQVARSSRQIADWYHKNNNLLIVQDPMASRNSIRPGAVMFFGKSNRTFKDIDIDMLTDRDNNYTSNGAIQHIAVVTAVTLDEDGNVVDYTMMHGRRPGKTAHRSGSKEVQSRNKKLPAYGHWSQQWVGIANIATPKM
ncbi:MAG: hypothetical protein AB8F94_02530 [Saprospiraceae bacterium]